jgi:hypothetical protein
MTNDPYDEEMAAGHAHFEDVKRKHDIKQSMALAILEVTPLKRCPFCGDNDWKPIETAPHHQDVLVYREDAGVFMGHYGCVADWLVDGNSPEVDEYEEEAFWAEDWWSIGEHGAERLEGDMAPTHWHELPPPPATVDVEASPRFRAREAP